MCVTKWCVNIKNLVKKLNNRGLEPTFSWFMRHIVQIAILVSIGEQCWPIIISFSWAIQWYIARDV